jgi:hypothetical protein
MRKYGIEKKFHHSYLHFPQSSFFTHPSHTPQ